jgi:hypothetical protein
MIADATSHRTPTADYEAGPFAREAVLTRCLPVRFARIGRRLDRAERCRPVRADAAQLPIEIGLSGAEGRHCRGNYRISVRPIEPRPGQQTDRPSIQLGVKAIAIKFDLVHPFRSCPAHRRRWAPPRCGRGALIVWCKDCGHQVEPEPAKMAARYGAETTVLDWRERPVCSRCGARQVDMVVSGTKRR